MRMAIASDADENTSGSSGENENKKMAEAGGVSLGPTVHHHYYEKLKDFAFDMPGGWTDATIGLFIESFKQYKEDFSKQPSSSSESQLKLWQKIVKRCLERSDNHKVFSVNSVMELAGSLKSHVLRNECRKEDETFKALYNDVVDIMPFFPDTTCDSRPPRRNDATHPTHDALVLRYCRDMNLDSESYCSNNSWNAMSKAILEKHGVRLDVKKYLGEMKRRVAKEVREEMDPAMRRALFDKLVGPYRPFFDLMPPRTLRTQDFVDDSGGRFSKVEGLRRSNRHRPSSPLELLSSLQRNTDDKADGAIRAKRREDRKRRGGVEEVMESKVRAPLPEAKVELRPILVDQVVSPSRVSRSRKRVYFRPGKGATMSGPSHQSELDTAVASDMDRLGRLDESTVRIIEGYKEKVKETGNSVMQLIPRQKVGASTVMSSGSLTSTETSSALVTTGVPTSSALVALDTSLTRPPAWFDHFISDFKKHEMWKMHQLLKMQQELVDMENRKLNVLEKILSSINERNF